VIRAWQAHGRSAALLAALAMSGACGGHDGAPADAACARCWCEPAANAPAAELMLGTIDNGSFTPLADDATLDIHAGPQGGHHFLVAVRARSLDLTAVRTLLSASQSGADVDVLSCPYHYTYVAGADGWATLADAVPLVLDEVWLAAATREGARVTIRAEVQDDRGAFGVDERTVVAHLLY
jgi:hypothetical protein